MGILDKLDALKTEGNEIPSTPIEEQAPIETQTEQLEAQPEEAQGLEQQAEEQVQPEELLVDTGAETTEQISEEWQPTLKYKALGEEKEFHEWAKNFVTTPDLEEKFREVFAKADGLDFSIQKRNDLETKLAEVMTEHESKMKDATQLAELVQDFNTRISKNDPAEHLQLLLQSGLTEDAILDMARHTLQLRGMSAQERNNYDQQFVQRDQMNQYETQLNSTQNQLRQVEVQAAQAQLDNFLSTRKEVVEEFESREGYEAGDFQRFFIRFGADERARKGSDVDVKEVFKTFKKYHGLGRAKAKPAPRTIPNLKTSGHSPVSRSIKTMNDLRKEIGEI